MAIGDREGGGGGEGGKTVKVGQKISLKVNLKSFAPTVCTKSLPKQVVYRHYQAVSIISCCTLEGL